MTKEHIKFMETRADPGELLAGLGASINIFHGTTRSSSTSNTKRNSSRMTEQTSYEGHIGPDLAQQPMNNLRNMCLIEDKEIEVISGIYRRSSKGDDGVGHSAAHGNRIHECGSRYTEGVGQSAAPGRQILRKNIRSPKTGQVMDTIDAFFALADDNSVCVRCGESGHTNYECDKKDDDPVKTALINLRKKLQGEEVGEEGPQGEESKEPQSGYQATREGEYTFLRPIPLSSPFLFR